MSRSKEKTEKSHNEKPPKWLKSLLDHQTESLKSVINDALNTSNKSPNPSPKRRKVHSNTSKSKSSKPKKSHDDEDDFDQRFGHLIGPDVNNDKDDNNNDKDDDDEGEIEEFSDSQIDEDHSESEHYMEEEEDELNDSFDKDLVEILDKVPNWDPTSSLKKFISKTCDHSLPEEIIKKINDEYVPKEDLVEFFTPPKMPSRLINSISRMKSKNAIKTEKSLYNAQKELFVTAKPLLSALMDLKPLGDPVSKAREKLSISLQGIYSVSLRISRARRENVRFLFKFALAEALYAYDPTHSSLFGGSSFSAQVEKAAKEAKLDLAWSKTKPKNYSQSFQPFHAYNQRGFQYRGRGRGRGRGRYPSKRANYYPKQDYKTKTTKSSYQPKE